MNNVSKSVLITGKVQGVFFRVWTRQNAVSLGLDGWVRNTGNDGVEAVFSGQESRVKEMIERCYEGPEKAVVMEVKISEFDGELPSGFFIHDSVA